MTQMWVAGSRNSQVTLEPRIKTTSAYCMAWRISY